MSRLASILLLRHGETTGQSSIRFHGRTDLPLSEAGRRQVREAARSLPGDPPELVVSSPLRRAWCSAAIAAPQRRVELEPAFREVDFGRWEGLTAEEIEERDPVLYRDWRAALDGFAFPGGERRSAFRERVRRGLERLLARDAGRALVVCHKGVIRTIAEMLCGPPLDAGEPPLAGLVVLSRRNDGRWYAKGGRAPGGTRALRLAEPR